jgi:hypothetical protein
MRQICFPLRGMPNLAGVLAMKGHGRLQLIQGTRLVAGKQSLGTYSKMYWHILANSGRTARPIEGIGKYIL